MRYASNRLAIPAFSLILFLSLSPAAFAHDDDDENEMENESMGEMMSEMHRKNVSHVVEDLEAIADEDEDISEEIKEIADEEKESMKHAAQAMEAVENRGKFRTFFFGTDYKNIGALRSELVTTGNHINRLNKTKERATSEEVKASIDAQIAELEKAKTSAENFAKEHEDVFSVLGWFVRLFQ